MPKSFDPPLHATAHCRHYSYNGAPNCAIGVDLSKAGSCQVCMPTPNPAKRCPKRENYTEAERAAWKDWTRAAMFRAVDALVLIPGDSNLKLDRKYWGKSGSFSCPSCGGGLVRWMRASVNGHIHFRCSTPNCCAMMQ